MLANTKDEKCKVCGAAFQVSLASRSECCSADCTRKWTKAVAKLAPGLVSMSCVMCGSKFRKHPSQAGRFCSRKCMGQWQSEQALSLRTDPMQCNSCNETKPLEEFPKRGLKCKDCGPRKYHRGDNGRRRNLRRNFGLSPGQWAAMLAAQDGRCAICLCQLEEGRKEAHTDHDHLTGRLRGILCRSCNTGIGMFRDRPDLLRAAALYLLRHNVK